MADLVHGKHPAWNDLTDECDACGATRDEIDDNILTSCEPISGSHRSELIAIRRALWCEERLIRWAQRKLADTEEELVRWRNYVRRHGDQMQTLTKSFESIAGPQGLPKEALLSIAIQRLGNED
jgi:hypothetical protein